MKDMCKKLDQRMAVKKNGAGDWLAERTIDNERLKATNRTLLQVPHYVHEMILVS